MATPHGYVRDTRQRVTTEWRKTAVREHSSGRSRRWWERQRQEAVATEDGGGRGSTRRRRLREKTAQSFFTIKDLSKTGCCIFFAFHCFFCSPTHSHGGGAGVGAPLLEGATRFWWAPTRRPRPRLWKRPMTKRVRRSHAHTSYPEVDAGTQAGTHTRRSLLVPSLLTARSITYIVACIFWTCFAFME